MYLSVIIPAYNEQDRLASTLNAVAAYLGKRSYDYEIIVVSDGSKDKTVEIAERAAEYTPHMRIIANTENHGKGYVVRQGMLEAKGAYRLFMDADNSTNITNLDALFPLVLSGTDVVVSSRRLPGSHIEVRQSAIREFLGSVFRTIVSLIVPTGIKDTQNGFKLFTARAAEDIFRRQRILTWAFDVEIIAIARRLNYSISEVPVSWVNDERSHVTLLGMFRMLKEVLQIRYYLMTHAYGTRFAENAHARA